MKRLCVFCGANSGANDAYRSAAHELGRLLARSGIGFVYFGLCIGMMG
jgi:predicted Rossmann-fold nucleotide-binding protein